MEVTQDQKQYMDLMRPGSFIGAALTATGIKNSLEGFDRLEGRKIKSRINPRGKANKQNQTYKATNTG